MNYLFSYKDSLKGTPTSQVVKNPHDTLNMLIKIITTLQPMDETSGFLHAHKIMENLPKAIENKRNNKVVVIQETEEAVSL